MIHFFGYSVQYFLDNKYKNNLIAKRKTNVFYLVVSI